MFREIPRKISEIKTREVEDSGNKGSVCTVTCDREGPVK